MANRTVKDANSIHGTNPQYLVEKIIRTRIYESKYWKEECFGLTGEYSKLASRLTLAKLDCFTSSNKSAAQKGPKSSNL